VLLKVLSWGAVKASLGEMREKKKRSKRGPQKVGLKHTEDKETNL
jgi:hypothetical protein